VLRWRVCLPGLIAVAALLAQSARAETAMEMLRRALAATQTVEDYTADVTVSVDSPNLQIPRRTVRVWYKRPDRVHVESNGIAVLPRDALLLGNLGKHIADYAQASFNGTGTLHGRPVHAIKLTPIDAGPGTGRVLVWIDSERYLLLKSEIWRGGTRMITVTFEYTQASGHWMPSRIVATVAPGAMTGGDEGGRIEMTFANYRVNAGIPDSVFEEDE